MGNTKQQSTDCTLSVWSALFATISSKTKMHIHLEILTCDAIICTIKHPKFTLPYQMGESICIQRVQQHLNKAQSVLENTV